MWIVDNHVVIMPMEGYRYAAAYPALCLVIQGSTLCTTTCILIGILYIKGMFFSMCLPVY